MSARHLIVNADDFGLSAGVNRGILDTHQRGIVTATSLMVRQPAAEEAAQLAKQNPQLDIGLHFDIGEWFRDADGKWNSLYVHAERDDLRAIRKEFAAQLTRFRKLLCRNPTHLDSHQHVHRADGPARYVLLRAAKSFGIPLRHFSKNVRYCGDFYATNGDTSRLSADALINVIENIPPGVTELCCHPGDDETLESSYKTERRHELATLTDPRVRSALAQHGITLQTFATFPRPHNRHRPTWASKLHGFLTKGLDA